LILIQFAVVGRVMSFDEIDPTRVETAEASANLESAGYPEVVPFLRWVRRGHCARVQIDLEQMVSRQLTMLGVVQGPYPRTVDYVGNRHGRFHEFHSLN
jgi:hypothetical protein